MAYLTQKIGHFTKSYVGRIRRKCLNTGAKEVKRRAGDEARTRDIFLGKEVLYQLSYTRT